MDNAKNTNVVILQACPSCKAEARAGSEYCYNCGNDLHAANRTSTEHTRPAELPQPSENGAIKNGPGVRSADDNGRGRTARSRRLNTMKPVQVAWKREEDIGLTFILLTIGVAVFAILLIAIAYYLR